MINAAIGRFSTPTWAAVCVFGFWVAGGPLAAAQETPPDSAAVAVPALVTAVDSTKPAPKAIPFNPIDPYPATVGARVDSVLPARRVAFRLVDYLAGDGPAFLYDLGSRGWPHGVSFDGLSPNFVALNWNGIDYENPLTGRPLFEMIAVDANHAPSVVRVENASAASVVVEPRRFDQPFPLSEIFYRTDNAGLQSISATHSQSRLRTIGTSPVRIGFLFNYGGEGSSNEYPGSRLRRGRRAYLRASVTTNRLSVSVFEVYNRRRIGAHSGVIAPNPAVFNSIYQRLGASVVNSSAIRDNIRNDLGAVIRTRVVGSHPLTLVPSWTHGNYSFRDADDTVSTNFDRIALRVEQDASIRSGTLRLYGNFLRDRYAASTAIPDSLGRTRSEVRAGVIDTLRIGLIDVVTSAGVFSNGDATEPVLSGELAVRRRTADFSVQGTRRPLRLPPVMTHGYAGFLTVPLQVALPTNTSAIARTAIRAGVFDFAVSGFFGRTDNNVDIFMTSNPDSAVVRQDSAAFNTYGGAVEIGFRRTSESGVYLTGRASYFHPEAGEPPTTKRRLALPEYELAGAVGIRYVVFKGDLDFDLRLQTRFWPTFSSRTMHPATGLLAIPFDDQVSAPSSSTLDLVFEARVRTATVLLGYDNFLSGTTIVPGNLITPVYPLAERRLRFGIYWPIKN